MYEAIAFTMGGFVAIGFYMNRFKGKLKKIEEDIKLLKEVD